MRLDDWLEHARHDAIRRGLPDLEPLLDMLFQATRALRAADRAREDLAGSADPAGDSQPADSGPPPAAPGDER